MDIEKEALFQAFLKLRHRDYRAVNLEINETRSEIRSMDKLPTELLKQQGRYERFLKLKQRLSELLSLRDEQKTLNKLFKPKYYAIIDGVLTPALSSKEEARRLTGLPVDDFNTDEYAEPEKRFVVCTTCYEEKPFTDYYAHSTAKNGIYSSCKACIIIRNNAFKKRKEQEKKDDF